MQAAAADVPGCAAAAESRHLRYHAAPAAVPQHSGGTAGAMHTESLSIPAKRSHTGIPL
ncbi:hypothetical protein XCCB100_0118 [Xanthomonas campestris pv. campestris]|uniref:Uncharacterized protein n=1 Tax=Xanthomonas campestris pv. campestris (strain B100) TaxID=509169 RepID=B0RLM3_XANCB|nr:hypothetical protein XCCB100_0118 [Xanthomonas campestris pv. campestris]